MAINLEEDNKVEVEATAGNNDEVNDSNINSDNENATANNIKLGASNNISTIEEDINKIRHAVYGEEIREAIAGSLEKNE